MKTLENKDLSLVHAMIPLVGVIYWFLDGIYFYPFEALERILFVASLQVGHLNLLT